MVPMNCDFFVFQALYILNDKLNKDKLQASYLAGKRMSNREKFDRDLTVLL